MKRGVKRFISILLTFSMLVSVWCAVSVTGTSNEQISADYFVGFGGTGDGTSLSNPAPSVAVAVDTINKLGLTKDDVATIYIVQDIEKPSLYGQVNAVEKNYTAHNMAYWGNVAPHTAKIILKPHADNQKTNTALDETYLAVSDALGKQDQMILNGPCEFEDLRIIYPYGSSIYERIVIVTNGHNAVFGETLSYGYISCTSANEQNWTGDINILSGNQTPLLLGTGIAVSDKVYSDAFRLTFNNSIPYQSTAIYIPNYKTGNYTFNNDFTLELTGKNQGPYVVLGTAQGDAVTTLEKNLNFKITDPNATVRFKNGTDNVVVKGAVQLIASKGVGYALNANEPYPITNVTTLVKADSSSVDMWSLTVTPEYVDSIDFVEGEKGKFKVNENCIAYATDSDGNVTESKYGVLDLSAKSGEYNVEFECFENKVYDFYIKYGGNTYTEGDVYGFDGTHLNPYATVGDVLKAVNANDIINQAGNIVNVNVMQDITAIVGQKNKSHNMACWGETTPHKATVVLKDSGYNNYSGSVKSAYIAFSPTLSQQRQLKLGGPTVIDDVQMVYVSSSNVDAQKFVLDGNYIRISEKAKFSNLDLNGNSFDKFTTEPGNITSLLKENSIMGTWIAADTAEQPVVYNDEVKVVLDNGYTTSGNKAVFVGDSSSIFENDVTVEMNIGDNINTRVNLGKTKSEYVAVFEKNLNFKLRDSSSKDSDYFGFRPESAIIVKGGIHLIKSNNVHFHSNNPYDNFDDSVFKADGITQADSWILNVSEEDYDKINFINGEKGKFAINPVYQAVAKSVAKEGEKSKTVKSENGVLDLSDLTGEYNVTFKIVKEKTMFYYKEVKTKSGDTLLQQTEPLRAGVEYTMSFDYRINCAGLDETFYVSFYGGVDEPGSSKIIKTQFFSTREQHQNLFPEFSYNGKTATFKFTLTEEQVQGHKYFYMGFRYLPGTLITEAYFANMTLYETLDETKQNLFLSDEFETTIDNWYSNRGATQSGNNKVFERSDVDFTAYYLPYNELYFDTPTDTHFGDSNLDGDIDILDLVSIDELIKSNKDYITTVDANDDGVLDTDDLLAVKKHLIGKEIYEWTEKEIGLMKPIVMDGGSDEQADALKEQILSAPDTLTKASSSNKVYYVAANGSAGNDGLSTSKPITADAVNSLSLKAGDLVLFKRGDTMRLSEMIKPVRGVSYGAYGSGDKPVLLGSLKNYADASLWKSEDNNMWKIYLGTEDAGQVIFNEGELLGFRKHTLEEVHFNGDFYYNAQEKTLYMYLNNINPGIYFDSIEIATTSRAFGTWGSLANPVNDLKFENLCMKYFSLFAFNISYTDGIDITNCEMGWIGGQITGSNADRFGNAVQFWCGSKNANVSNNYIYQVFDAAITFQGSVDNIYSNLTFNDNLIEYCSMNFEFWGTGSSEEAPWDGESDVMHNIKFEDNILRFSGYGWGGMQRKLKPNQAFVLAWNNKYEDGQIKDFTIKNNVFDVANSRFYYGVNTFIHIDVSSNTYYQKPGSIHSVVSTYANDLASFESEIKTVDLAPGKIEWIN